ncbi:MAG: Flp pilus assembly protein CpaB [Alphaproteobacteria bacterium]|nr:Flp pilus assembly protein CpaB [Alphaproteobacteria bacterium]
MNKNILIVLAGGLVIAILVAVLVQASLKDDAPQVQIKEEDRVQIVVAAKDLKAGKELGADDLRWQAWPKAAVFSGAIVRQKDEKPLDVVSGRLARSLSADEPVMASAILKTDANYLAATLPKGMRAIAFSVKADTMAGGFVTPGDHVDIIMTFRPVVPSGNPEEQRIIDRNINKLAAETILQNVKILAVDQRASRGEAAALVGRTVTVQVSAMDAEKIALAADVGELILALRGIGDDAPIVREWPVVTDARLTNIIKDLQTDMLDARRASMSSRRTPVPVANSAGENTRNVRIYNGDIISDISSR